MSRDLAASIRARLKNHAEAAREDFNLTLTRYGLEEFGGIGFQIQPFETTDGTQEREVAILNEQQATLRMTYMRNSDIVRDFKKRLVKAFWNMARRQVPEVPQTFHEALQLAAN